MLRTLLGCLFMLCLSQVNGQQMRVLSQANQERIARLEELVEYHLLEDDVETAISYLNQISYTYWENGRPDKAIESFKRTAEYYEQLNDLENLQKIYSNIALIYMDMEDIRGAREGFTKKLETQRRIGQPRGIVSALVDLAYVKNLEEEHREALDLLEEAQELATQNNFESVLPNIHRQLSNNYFSIGNIREGEAHRNKYQDIQEHVNRQAMRGEYQEREEQSQVEALRSQAETRARELEMQLNEIIFQEKQDSITMVVQIQEDSLTIAHQRDSIQNINIRQLENERRLQQAEIERQEAVQNFQLLVIYSVAGGLVLLLFLAVIMFRSNKAKQKANRELAAKNKQIEKTSAELKEAFNKIEDQNFRITQSISYAREIQKALFPPKETLNYFLPEAFIFFKPVDMVSGDFYWFGGNGISATAPENSRDPQATQKLQTQDSGILFPQNTDRFIITAVDCTGHGVPGAFMSMIGYNLLDSITQNGTNHAGPILNKLNNGVRAALKQDETTNRDGMDISLCVINKKDKTVEFAGANNPVIYIQNGELNVIKGNRMAIGGGQKSKERNFDSHTIRVDQPTWFYILTDGYTDQFGGENRRKFMMKNMKKLIESMYLKPMKEQQAILEQTFHEWKGDEEQIDDVLVIGFKLG